MTEGVPSRPVVETLHLNPGGTGLVPGRGTKIYTRREARLKGKKKKPTGDFNTILLEWASARVRAERPQGSLLQVRDGSGLEEEERGQTMNIF